MRGNNFVPTYVYFTEEQKEQYRQTNLVELFRSQGGAITVTKLVLNNDNQFNGTVEFTAYDRSENNTDMADEERTVVDNIKLTSKITFNGPVQNTNNISYYLCW